MKTKRNQFLEQNKNILLVALATAFVLLVPWLAMRFTGEVHWTPFDFAVAGTLLFGAGLTYELITSRAGNTTYMIAAALALFTALFLLWANFAVGIIGSEDNPANWMYAGVLAVAIIGALVARLRAFGMSNALFVTAFAQASVGAIALLAGMHRSPDASVSEILSVNGFFVLLWLVSALLFRRAGA